MSDPQQLRARIDEVLERHDAGELDEALTAVDALLAAAEDHDPADPVVRESIFAGRFERALLLTELGELEAAATAYEEAAATPADLDNPDQRHEVAMALLGGGICLDAIGDHDAAIRAYDQLVERFAAADDPVTTDQVVRARVNRTAALLGAGRVEEALAAADALLDGLDPTATTQIEQLTMTLRLRALALRELGRVPDAVGVLATVETLPAEDPAARVQVAAAERDRAQLLAELGRHHEAVALLDAAITRARADPDPVVAEAAEELLETQAELRERADAEVAHRSRPPA